MSDAQSPSSRGQSPSGSANGAEISDASADDAVKSNREASANEEESVKNTGIDEDELFGDEPADSPSDSPKRRTLDDEELDSGDDEGRDDRMEEDGNEDMDKMVEEEEFNYMDAELIRHAVPCPSDNELYLLKVPRFLSIDPAEWHHENFQPPVTDHHSKSEPSPTFSAFNTAMTTLRWRRSPSNPKELQSNARILRWSDGSLTLQFATDPTTQYDIDGNPLAPPQRNPPKPTPTSIVDNKKGSRNNNTNTTTTTIGTPAPYNPGQDTFTYLAAPNESAALLRLTNKITAGLSIVPSAVSTDDALERLQTSLAAAVRGKNLTEDGGIALVDISEDPELAKKKAEVAEREKDKAQKRREAQEMRERDRANRFLSRSGLRTGGYGGYGGGLSAGMLEDDDDELGEAGDGGAGGGAGLRRARSGMKKMRRQRRDRYSDEEEGFGRRKTKEDEYDEEDDFIAKSDEEEEIVEDDEDEDEDEDEDADADGDADADADGDEEVDADGDDVDQDKGSHKQRDETVTAAKDAPSGSPESPKRSRPDKDEMDENDGEDVAPAIARTKRRKVVDDEDEDE